jgi:hypothetical protein
MAAILPGDPAPAGRRPGRYARRRKKMTTMIRRISRMTPPPMYM